MIWLSLFLYCAGFFLWLAFEKANEHDLDFGSFLFATCWPLITPIGAGIVLYNKIKKKN